MVNIEPSWYNILKDEFEKEYFLKLIQFVHQEYASGVCYPPGKLIFNAFWQTPIDNIKVVILGQDPYHEPGQAQGLCFSVPNDIPAPPSLVNIIKEVQAEGFAGPYSNSNYSPCPSMGANASESAPYNRGAFAEGQNAEGAQRAVGAEEKGLLTYWAQQGVFLLNTCLSVRQHQAFSHSNQGWETFTDAVIKAISDHCTGIVFLLWGAPAGRKANLIDQSKHLILTSAHPSPLSAYRGFFGNNHFIKCNEYLTSHGKEPINW